MEEKKRFYNIDFLRFLLAAMIIYYHLTPMCAKFYSITFLSDLSMKSQLVGRCAVSAFFLLSGFFLYISTNKKKLQTTYEFMIQRIIRLWPLMAFSFVPLSLIGIFNKYTDILNIFFISSGLGVLKESSSNDPTWFICVLFFLSLFFHFLIKHLRKDYLICLCSILSLYSFIILAHASNGLYSKIVLPSLDLTAGMVRGIGGISLGIVCGWFWEKIKNKQYNISVFKKLIITFIEVFLLCFYLKYNIYHLPKFNNVIYWQLIFVGIFFLFLVNKGYLSNLLNNKFLGQLGKYSFSLFVMHKPVILICRKCLWGEGFAGGGSTNSYLHNLYCYRNHHILLNRESKY